LTCYLYKSEYGTLKLVKVILRRGKGKRENNGEAKQKLSGYIVHMCGNVTTKFPI
jgi:hypothetical protein